MMEKVPSHIAIILDGNRRFSKKLMLKPWMGHEWGAKKVEKLLEWASEFNIRELTLYTMSVQNFQRPKEEFNYLMDLMRKEFKRISSDGRLEKNGIRINFIGRLSMFPEDIQAQFKDLMESTKKNSKHIVNFAMAYGGREEVIDAVRKLAEEMKEKDLGPQDIDESKLDSFMYIQSKPDMIIRTGGEKRLSNFLLWQSDYSELFFIDKMWPEFEKEDLQQLIAEYSSRNRRFGK